MPVICRLLVICVVWCIGATMSLAQTGTLTVFNWAHYLSPQVIQTWQEQSGIVVEEAYFDDDVERDRIINRRSYNTLDVVVLDEIASHNFLANGKMLDLTQYDIPNRKYIPQLWQQQCGNGGIPYFWGTLGLAYRKDIYSTPPDSWRELVTPKPVSKKHIVFMSDYVDMFMPFIFLKNLSIGSADESHYKSIYHELEKLIPNILTFDYVLSYAENHPDTIADIHLAMAYSGDEKVLNQLDPRFEWGFVTPKEGTIIWVDCFAVPAKSRNIEQAVRFINYLSDPQVAANLPR